MVEGYGAVVRCCFVVPVFVESMLWTSIGEECATGGWARDFFFSRSRAHSRSPFVVVAESDIADWCICLHASRGVQWPREEMCTRVFLCSSRFLIEGLSSHAGVS